MQKLISIGKLHSPSLEWSPVIRGETLHFELVANECARGVMEASLKHDVPVIFEVLATRNRRDALARAGNNRLNKGYEAAQAALSMIAALERIQ